jgi:hypothetical protein
MNPSLRVPLLFTRRWSYLDWFRSSEGATP